jgi:hydrogenase expression/formation protein HypE
MVQEYRPITATSTANVALEVHEEPEQMVLMHTGFGSTRMIDMLVGDPLLPRIC